MNIERMLRVADAIEKHEISWLGFNMTYLALEIDDFTYADNSGHACGSAGCIAGWTIAVFKKFKKFEDFEKFEEHYSATSEFEAIWDKAMKLLGLTEEESSDLFNPCGPVLIENMKDITPCEAVNQLRYAALTGDCRWPKNRGG